MAQSSGFGERGLDEDAFGDKSGLSGLKTFDAFPKTKPSYAERTTRGGQFTLALIILSILLSLSELKTWWAGAESHHFSVERGVSHELQINLDIVVKMRCEDLHVNVQDAAGDRVMAGELLRKDQTVWALWGEEDGKRKRRTRGGTLNRPDEERREREEEDQHVGHVLGHMKEGGRKFAKSPRLRRGETSDACRIYGSLEGNKVQGDFHITARGHGYAEWGIEHLDHQAFNFSHAITELSFGPHYPSLLNPLDHTLALTPSTETSHFHKFQYYLSIVPTIYTRRRVLNRQGTLDPASVPQPRTLDLAPHVGKDGKVTHVDRASYFGEGDTSGKTVFTNQYAATSQSRDVGENVIPGIFFKYDIEPILLVVAEQRAGFLGLLVRLVNVVSGILVGGAWAYQIYEWSVETILGRRGRRRSSGGGMLYGGKGHD